METDFKGSTVQPVSDESGAAENHENAHVLTILSGVAEAMRSIVNTHTEIVVHDLLRPESSIATIVNGHVSGRHAGQSLLAVPSGDKAFDQMVSMGEAEEPDAVVVVGDYISYARDGRALRSASTIIYNGERKPVAAFCLNVDATVGEQAFRQLQSLLFPPDTSENPALEVEKEDTTMEGLVAEIIEQAVASNGCATERMTKQEKMAAVSIMHARGIFLIRGSVERVARRLGTTKFTIYNYLEELGLK